MSATFRTACALGALLLFPLSNAAHAREPGEVRPLAGTEPLEMEGDIASRMVEGIDKFLMRELAASVDKRAARWHRDLSSPEKYEASVADKRKLLARIIGAVDERVPIDGLELISTTNATAVLGRATRYEVLAVRWPVLEGVTGEGLLVIPDRALHPKPIACCIAVPDADWTPEFVMGMENGGVLHHQFARRLAEAGCLVVVPTLINRDDTFSIAANGQRPTNQPHREFVYRPAYEMGRHVIGYEVQKLLAVIDWFSKAHPDSPIGIAGFGEGGLLALYTAALDTRVGAALVSGYYGPRERLWEEPIYRNVWSLLNDFGDAELATLVAPRGLVIENGDAPLIVGPPPAEQGRFGAAPGKSDRPAQEAVEAELARARKAIAGLKGARPFELIDSSGDDDSPCCQAAIEKLLESLGMAAPPRIPESSRPDMRLDFDPQTRLRRQLTELNDYTQKVVARSPDVRAKYWAAADRASRDPAKWEASIRGLRTAFYDEVIGRFDRPLEKPNPRTRQVYDEPKYTGYEVVIDVFPEVFASGILLLPKDLKPGERRPVVVCQHGLEGRAKDCIEANDAEKYYHRFAARLAEEGFITYSPQNPYIFKDRFRVLQRKANPLGKSLYSIIVPQHQQTVDWLATLPMVDAERIAFYGLSYGGKTAMRVPALVERYCLSICSGDFNEWIWKNTSLTYRGSYVGTPEYEIFEWNLGNTFNYAEMAGLIAPRPFMVERGHRDGVGLDEWVSYEYAKVRLLYADLNIPDRTRIEYFDGPHTIHGVGTFAFLHEKLRYP